MKKVILLAAIAAALVSCQSKTKKEAVSKVDSLAMEVIVPELENLEVFEGTLPATKTSPAVNYVLTLDVMTGTNDTVYTLDMTYLDANHQPTANKTTVKGKPQMIHHLMKDAKKKPVVAKTMKLTPADGSNPVYFAVINDSTLTLMKDSLPKSIKDHGLKIIRVKKHHQ